MIPALVVLAGLPGRLLLALALPLRVSLDAATVPAPHLRLRLRALCILPWVTLVDSRTLQAPAGPDTTARRRPRLTPRLRRALQAAPRLLARLAGRVHVDRLCLDADMGLGDPALTGEAFGLATPILYALPRDDRWQVALRPDFNAERLEGSASLDLRLTPLALVPPLADFGWRVLRGAR